MRIVSTIDRPLRDEHVLAVDPPLQPELPDFWRRRINPFGGRALSAAALAAEQEVRSGVQLLRGQSVTAGIVSGLDLLLEPNAAAAGRTEAIVQILPGFGLTHSGEDIAIASPRRLALGDLPIYARVDHLDAAGVPPAAADSLHGHDEPPSGGAFASLPPLRPRRLGPPLRDAIAANVELPRVAILVAEPVMAEIVGRADPASPCPRDPRDDPYDDWQRIDGCRLTLAFWPDDLVAGGAPDYALPAPGPSFRNRLAYGIFTIERRFLPGEAHPWEWLGVPLGLVAFKADWTLDFVDRAAVVRLGGRPNPRTPLVSQTGSPLLYQAQRLAIRRASRGARRSDAGDARRDAAPSASGGVAAARSDRPADAQADFLSGWVHVDGGPGSARTPRSHRRRKRRARSDSARCRGRGRASGAGARARLRARPAGDRGSRSRVRAQHRPLRRRPHRVAHAARAGATAARYAG